MEHGLQISLKDTHFQWKIKWRLGHLGTLGIMGDTVFRITKGDITRNIVAPKSYQREGQPRKTKNEFSHDSFTIIQSDDLGKSKMPVFYVFRNERPTSGQCHNVHKYLSIILLFCANNVEYLTFPVILKHRSLHSTNGSDLFTKLIQVALLP